MFAARGADGVKTLAHSLFAYELDEERLPDEAIEFLARSREMRPDEEVTAGQEVFQELGPEILLILGCYSLPAAYAATRGARVLSQTGFLTEDTDRRLAETSQMVLDVMSAGGLTPTDAVRAAEKVRLMHAAIRHLILGRTDQPWDQPENGLPINQEDFAATLMTFSYLVVDGLRKLGFSVTAGEAADYLEAWKLVGRLMGVLPELIPANFAEAKALTERIEQRQIAPGEVGRSLLTALLRVLDAKTTPGVPAALMRRMLPRPVADGLGVPRHAVRDDLVLALTIALRLLDPLLRLLGTRTRAFRVFSMDLLQYMIDRDRGGSASLSGSRPSCMTSGSSHCQSGGWARGLADQILGIGAPATHA